MNEEPLDFTKLKYVLYARKSTTDESRQVRSISDQISDCQAFAKRNGFSIVKILEETKSAKIPRQRPIYTQMLKDIKAGKYDGILAWNPDRLARNMLEGGELIDMIDNNIIKDLKFVTHHFTKDANVKMLLGMAFVLSKQYSDDLSQKVTRGVRKSFAEGKSPTPKHGYIRDETGLYRPDGKNFVLIKTAWQMRIVGHSLEAISELINKSGYGRNVKRTGRKVQMDKRMLSDVFHDSFYYGLLIQAGKQVDLRDLYDFEPTISEEDFFLLQKQYYQKSLPYRKKRHTFYPFKMMIHCSFCHQQMRVGASKGKTKRYLNFRCDTKGCVRKKKSLRVKVLLDFIYQLLEDGLNFTDAEYRQYYEDITAIQDENRQKLLVELHNRQGVLSAVERERRERGLAVLEKGVNTSVKQINEERIAELDNQKDELLEEIKAIKEQITDPEKEKLSLEQFLNLSKNAAKTVKAGDAVQKDAICRIIFLNFTVNEVKVLSYQAKEPFATLLKQRQQRSSRGAENRTPSTRPPAAHSTVKLHPVEHKNFIIFRHEYVVKK